MPRCGSTRSNGTVGFKEGALLEVPGRLFSAVGTPLPGTPPLPAGGVIPPLPAVEALGDCDGTPPLLPVVTPPLVPPVALVVSMTPTQVGVGVSEQSATSTSRQLSWFHSARQSSTHLHARPTHDVSDAGGHCLRRGAHMESTTEPLK